MPKFSLIIPVYNVEKYIKKCLDSVFDQSFKDFEVIAVNDGTKDNSMDIVRKYNVNIIEQENQGLSEARNVGVKNAKGDYLVFVDGDDYVEKDLLKKINESLNNNPDIVRYQTKLIVNDKTIEYHEKEFVGKTGEDAFKEIVSFRYVEPAWLYAIKKSYYLKNKFSFEKGAYHEDFGLIPLVVFKSKKINSIDYCGYCYVQRSGSIMTDKAYDKTIRKVNDVYSHYHNLMESTKNSKEDTKYFKSFIANSLIFKITELNKKDYKLFKKKLKKEKVFDNMLCDTFARKVKKYLICFSPRLYYKLKRK